MLCDYCEKNEAQYTVQEHGGSGVVLWNFSYCLDCTIQKLKNLEGHGHKLLILRR